MGWTSRLQDGERKLLCCFGSPQGREEGREMLPTGRRVAGSRCTRKGQTRVLSPRPCFQSPAPPSAGCSLQQNVSVAVCQPVCYFSAATWWVRFILQFKFDCLQMTHLRIVAWLPGLVREHWPKGKVEVISMMSSSSSSSTSTVSEEPLYDSCRAWGSPAAGWGCRGGCGRRRTGEKALRRPASPVTTFSWHRHMPGLSD